MNPYHSLTDEQLAEWHMLTVKVERLTADLAESRKATESVQAAAEEERTKLRAELNRRAETILDLKTQSNHRQYLVREHAAALVKTLGALRRLLDALKECRVHGKDEAAGAVFQDVEREAAEVVREHDIPF